jgi:hypothetical protein
MENSFLRLRETGEFTITVSFSFISSSLRRRFGYYSRTGKVYIGGGIDTLRVSSAGVPRSEALQARSTARRDRCRRYLRR